MTSCDPAHYYWHGANVSSCALHNLTNYCPNVTKLNETEEFVAVLDSPGTFFVQLIRLSLSLAIFTVVVAVYNCINVLDKNILSAATCSLLWLIIIFLTSLKAGLLMVLIPVAHYSPYLINLIGFVLTTIVQSSITYILILALDHERRFRSPDYASIDSPRRCVGLKVKRLLCSWFRLAALGICLIPLAVLVALEIVFQTGSTRDAHSAIAWVYMASLLLTRLVVIATAIHLVLFTKGNCEPTTPAKIYICVALLLSIAEDLPSSLLAVAPYQPNPMDEVPCTLEVMTIYDLFQLFGCFSLVFFALFVRSQYLRIEQECKLVLVWDLQKLLQVNGRKDVIKHYT